ncbi:MAG TPA: hypothetical protein VK731_00710 [Candidatus Cybelea sp.]|nr:hypothetical protein [Candidatus Cybelea sp.]
MERQLFRCAGGPGIRLRQAHGGRAAALRGAGNCLRLRALARLTPPHCLLS